MKDLPVTAGTVHHHTYAEIAAQLRQMERERHHLYKVLGRIIEALADGDPGAARMIAQLAYLDRDAPRPGTQVVAPITDAILNRGHIGGGQ